MGKKREEERGGEGAAHLLASLALLFRIFHQGRVRRRDMHLRSRAGHGHALVTFWSRSGHGLVKVLERSCACAGGRHGGQ
eukprot:2894450-Rhodomonas_salina.5